MSDHSPKRYDSIRQRTAVGIATLTMVIGTLLLVKARGRWPAYADLHRWIAEQTEPWIAGLDHWFVLTFLSVTAIAAMHRKKPRGIWHELGLTAPLTPALVFAFIAAAPMMVGYAALGTFSPTWALLSTALIGPFVEELFFRGFAYRQLHQRAGWGFWPAATVTGLIFGLAHLSLSDLLGLDLDTGDLFTVLITGVGGVFYAWLLMRWDFNLWVVVFLHAFMNLWWAIFAISESAVGGFAANLCRGLTIALAIVLTLTMRYRRLLPLRRGTGERGHE